MPPTHEFESVCVTNSTFGTIPLVSLNSHRKLGLRGGEFIFSFIRTATMWFVELAGLSNG